MAEASAVVHPWRAAVGAMRPAREPHLRYALEVPRTCAQCWGADRGVRSDCIGRGSEPETRGLQTIDGEHWRYRCASGHATVQARPLPVRRPERDDADREGAERGSDWRIEE